jgi:glycyl-tRNA synthetase beta chain
MGGIYARREGQPEAVWKAIAYQYLPVGVEPTAPPTREQLGEAAVTWAAVSVADKLDSVVGMFAIGERPTGTRDPYALRRQTQGLLRVLVDLPELVGLEVPVSLNELTERALGIVENNLPQTPPREFLSDKVQSEFLAFAMERLRFLFERRGFKHDEINAVLSAEALAAPSIAANGHPRGFAPLDIRRRLEGLQAIRSSPDFEALAVAFKRVKNIARERAGSEPLPDLPQLRAALGREEAEQALCEQLALLTPQIETAVKHGDYRAAFLAASAFRPAVDRFFTDVFVMVDDAALRQARLALVTRLRDLIIGLADISEIAGQESA